MNLIKKYIERKVLNCLPRSIPNFRPFVGRRSANTSGRRPKPLLFFRGKGCPCLYTILPPRAKISLWVKKSCRKAKDLWLNQVRASVSTAIFRFNSLRIVHSIHSCKCIQFAHTSAFNSLMQVHSIHSDKCIQFTYVSAFNSLRQINWIENRKALWAP